MMDPWGASRDSHKKVMHFKLLRSLCNGWTFASRCDRLLRQLPANTPLRRERHVLMQAAPAPQPTPAPAPPPAPAAAPAPPAPAPAAAAGEQPETTSNEKALLELYQRLQEEDPRDHLNIVFIGHVDAGKSTLAGMQQAARCEWIG